MIKATLICGAVVLTVSMAAQAKEFPLEFKTLTAREAMSFPDGSGLYASLQRNKPSHISKEPPAKSKYALYGRLSGGNRHYWFRLDESKGDGKGYDRLIVDLNQNGDLTDDAVAKRVSEPRENSRGNQPDVALFGPIPAPKDKMIGTGRPIYFARMYLFRRPLQYGSSVRNAYLGQLRLKPGWYLEAETDWDGVQRKIGIVDGNCSLTLGEANEPTTYKNGNETNWYFRGGDYFLEDRDGSGKFESSFGRDESAPFGPLFYLGAKPYQATLAADRKSLALEPWTEPLATLALRPHGEQVSAIQVAWEGKSGDWQLLEPSVANGKVTVPPGRYRLYTCLLQAKTGAGDDLIVSGYKHSMQDTLAAKAGETVRLPCGAPLELQVTVRSSSTAGQSSGSLVSRIVSSLFGSNNQTPKQLIQATIVGAGGETYSSFYLKNKKGLRQPPKPAFSVITADGKEVGSGDLEFG